MKILIFTLHLFLILTLNTRFVFADPEPTTAPTTSPTPTEDASISEKSETTNPPKAPFTRKVHMELEEVPGATAYEIELKTKDSNKAQLFKLKTPLWDSNLEPGSYSIRLRSYDNRNVPGKWNEPTELVVAPPPPPPKEIKVAKKPAEKIKVKKQVPPKQWYAVASYFITQVQYDGENPEINKRISYDAAGGTGRLGLGYINIPKNTGYFGVLDTSGIIVAGRRIIYLSTEAHYVWHHKWGAKLLRTSAGVFYREIFESHSTLSQPNVYSPEKISYVGPHAGFDFSQPLSRKLGYQINMRLFYGALGIHSPNGEKQIPTLSTQFGLMGSYKFRTHVTGLVGLSHKVDTGEYESTTQTQSPTESLANAGATQKIKISGNYLNLQLEWEF